MTMKLVNYNHLAVLTVCVHTRNYSAAARILRRKQPAITASIRTLSRALGDPLFVPLKQRGCCGRNMIPTPLAEDLAHLMRPVLDHVIRLETSLTHTQSPHELRRHKMPLHRQKRA